MLIPLSLFTVEKKATRDSPRRVISSVERQRLSGVSMASVATCFVRVILCHVPPHPSTNSLPLSPGILPRAPPPLRRDADYLL